MSLCEKFKKPKIRSQPAVLCVFEYIFKMQADLTISLIFKEKKNVLAIIVFYKRAYLEIDEHILLSKLIHSFI